MKKIKAESIRLLTEMKDDIVLLKKHFKQISGGLCDLEESTSDLLKGCGELGEAILKAQPDVAEDCKAANDG